MTEVDRAQRRISWPGHATVLIETGGARLLTDPVLRTHVAHLVRRVPAAPHPGPVDAVLISHAHQDHLDRPSLRTLAGAGTEAILPTGTQTLLRGIGFRSVHEVRAGDTIDVAGTTVEAVEAWHPTGATLGVD